LNASKKAYNLWFKILLAESDLLCCNCQLNELERDIKYKTAEVKQGGS